MAKPVTKIIEEPASGSARFRYESEASVGYILGVNSTPDCKTFPAIRIDGFKGKAYVVVSCVTKDPPYKPHPHNVVGKVGCKNGVCILEIPQETMTVAFSYLGIQCVKKKNVGAALTVREEMKVDPFNTKFAHRNQPSSIDLNVVRLCFQVFIKEEGKFTKLEPVVSEPVHNRDAVHNLNIIKLSDCVSSVAGGTKDIVLVCEKIKKEDIKVRFFEERDGRVVWEAFGNYHPSQSYKQTSLWFRTPPYVKQDVTEPVKVFIQLFRPSDGETSEALPFQLLPVDAVSGKRKRIKPSELLLQLQQQDQNRAAPQMYHDISNLPTTIAGNLPIDSPQLFNFEHLPPFDNSFQPTNSMEFALPSTIPQPSTSQFNNLLDLGNHQLESMLSRSPSGSSVQDWNFHHNLGYNPNGANAISPSSSSGTRSSSIDVLFDLLGQQLQSVQRTPSVEEPHNNFAMGGGLNAPNQGSNGKELSALNIGHGELDNADKFDVNYLVDSLNSTFSLTDINLEDPQVVADS